MLVLFILKLLYTLRKYRKVTIMKEILSQNIPGIVTGIITGIVILIIEYRTNWFANRRGGHQSIKGQGLQKVSRPNLDFVDIVLQTALFISTFSLVFLLLGVPLSMSLHGSPETALDTPSENIVVETIGENDTRTFFGNAIFISVSEIFLEKISFTISAPSYPAQQIEQVQNGFVTNYEDALYKYEIRVTSIRGYGIITIPAADFAIIRTLK